MTSRFDIEDMSETGHVARQAAAMDDPSVRRADRGMPQMVWRHADGTINADAPARHWEAQPYVRADLACYPARPSQAGDERVARLVEAARDVIEGWDWWTVDEYDRDRGAVSDGIHDLRAALAAVDTPKGGGDE